MTKAFALDTRNGALSLNGNSPLRATINGTLASDVVEARGQIRIRIAGTYYLHSILLDSNTRVSDSTFAIRVNGVNQANQALTIPTGTSGRFSDTSATGVAVADGDLVNHYLTVGAGLGAIGLRQKSWAFEASSGDAVSKIGMVTGSMISFGTTRYIGMVGLGGTTTTEDPSEIRCPAAGTFENAQIFLQTNTVNAASTATLRINGANSALAVTLTASTTGWFEDTTNSVAVVAGDTVNWAFVLGGTAGSLVPVRAHADYISSSPLFGNGFAGGQLQNAGTTHYYGLGGVLNVGSIAGSEFPIYFAGTLSGLGAYISTNGASSSTMTLVVGGVDTSVVLTVPGGGGTGYFSTVGQTYTFAGAGELAYLRYSVGATNVALTQTDLGIEGGFVTALTWYPPPVSDLIRRPVRLGAAYQAPYSGNSFPQDQITAVLWAQGQPHYPASVPAAAPRQTAGWTGTFVPSAQPVPSLSWQARYPDRITRLHMKPPQAHFAVPSGATSSVVPLTHRGWLPAYPEQVHRFRPHASHAPFLFFDERAVLPVEGLGWLPIYPDRLYDKTSIAAGSQTAFHFHPQEIPDPPPPGLGYETALYPAIIAPRVSLGVVSQQVFGINLDPIPNLGPPTDSPLQPVLPDPQAAPSRRFAGAWIVAPILPEGTALGRWWPVLPATLPGRRPGDYLGGYTGPDWSGWLASISTLKWLPLCPDVMPRLPAIGLLMLADPSPFPSVVTWNNPHCIFIEHETVAGPSIGSEDLSGARLGDEDLQSSDLSGEKGC